MFGPPARESLAMPKVRIVVVEDEPAIRRGVVDALKLTDRKSVV